VIAGTLADADVALLDRVVCCYPMQRRCSRERQREHGNYSRLHIPRDRWHVRAMIAIENFLLRLRGSPFWAFVHPPQQMSAVLERAGLVCAAPPGTLVWVVELYCRKGDNSDAVDVGDGQHMGKSPHGRANLAGIRYALL
jgi:hypothetical protein